MTHLDASVRPSIPELAPDVWQRSIGLWARNLERTNGLNANLKPTATMIQSKRPLPIPRFISTTPTTPLILSFEQAAERTLLSLPKLSTMELPSRKLRRITPRLISCTPVECAHTPPFVLDGERRMKLQWFIGVGVQRAQEKPDGVTKKARTLTGKIVPTNGGTATMVDLT